MYEHNDDKLTNKSQAVASTDLYLEFDDNIENVEQTRKPIADLPLDPVGIFVWEIVETLIDQRGQITIKEVLEALEQREGTIKPGDSALRERLNQLTELGLLECLPGSGRRPSYYFLAGDERLDINSTETSDADILHKIEQKQLDLRQNIKEMEQQLAILIDDQQAMEQVIQTRQKLRRKYR